MELLLRRDSLDILSYFKDVNAKKQLDTLARKFAGKKIVIYGAGEYFNILNENYDLSKFNIIAICDKKFETSKDLNTTKFEALIPKELKEYDYDVILVALLRDIQICDYLERDILINTKNEDKKVLPMIEPNLFYLIKVFLGIAHE